MFARIVKLATVSIFSLIVAPPLAAHCKKAEKSFLAKNLWREISQTWGNVRLPVTLQLCIGNSYFHEIPHGNKIRSALDRRRLRIVLRKEDEILLRHELAHLYLDLRWRPLPYSTSEFLVRTIVSKKECATNFVPLDNETVRRQWIARRELDTCGITYLLKNIFAMEPFSRNLLPIE